MDSFIQEEGWVGKLQFACWSAGGTVTNKQPRLGH